MHAGLGLASEAGEFIDVLKKRHAYGKPLDIVNLREEVGDILWYCALAARGLGTTLEEIAETNILKLQTRYPAKFTAEQALNRNLTAERAVLEGDSRPAMGAHAPFETSNRHTVSPGIVLQKFPTGWKVVSNGTLVIAETTGTSTILQPVKDVSTGTWLWAAQETLNEVLKK